MREETYKYEKMIKLANYQKRTALISRNLFEADYFWGLFHSFDDKSEDFLYDTSPYIRLLNHFEKNNKIIVGFIFIGKEAAMADFYAHGGSFTEEELKQPNFNNLLDRNFILKY